MLSGCGAHDSHDVLTSSWVDEFMTANYILWLWFGKRISEKQGNEVQNEFIVQKKPYATTQTYHHKMSTPRHLFTSAVG